MRPVAMMLVAIKFVAMQLMQILIEAIEAQLPMLPVLSYPTCSLLQRLSLEQAGSPLRITPACNESGVLEHLQVFRYGRQAHGKRRCELADRDRAAGDTRENGAPGRIGKRGEGDAQPVRAHLKPFG